MYARHPANPDGNVDYTGPAATEDAYERAKQAKQDALAAQTALVKTSLQEAQRDFEHLLLRLLLPKLPCKYRQTWRQ